MDQANIVIVGGGVVGCAIARALSTRWDDVFLLEAMPEARHGHQHPQQRRDSFRHLLSSWSLKAQHCVRGNQLTYEFCATHDVPHRKIGKSLSLRQTGKKRN